MTRAEQYSVNRREIGRTSPRLGNDQQLLFHEQAVGDDGPDPARSQEFGECCQKVGK